MAIRDEKGRFLKGHEGLQGAGRKSTEKEKAYLDSLKSAITPDDIKAIGEKIKQELLSGNLNPALVKIIFQYLVPFEQRKILEIVDDRALGEIMHLLQQLQNKGISPQQFFFEINKGLEMRDNEQLQ